MHTRPRGVDDRHRRIADGHARQFVGPDARLQRDDVRVRRARGIGGGENHLQLVGVEALFEQECAQAGGVAHRVQQLLGVRVIGRSGTASATPHSRSI